MERDDGQTRAQDEMEAFDALPPDLRSVLRAAPIAVPAIVIQEQLAAIGRDRTLSWLRVQLVQRCGTARGL